MEGGEHAFVASELPAWAERMHERRENMERQLHELKLRLQPCAPSELVIRPASLSDMAASEDAKGTITTDDNNEGDEDSGTLEESMRDAALLLGVGQGMLCACWTVVCIMIALNVFVQATITAVILTSVLPPRLPAAAFTGTAIFV